jgi:hypothetical protein
MTQNQHGNTNCQWTSISHFQWAFEVLWLLVVYSISNIVIASSIRNSNLNDNSQKVIMNFFLNVQVTMWKMQLIHSNNYSIRFMKACMLLTKITNFPSTLYCKSYSLVNHTVKNSIFFMEIFYLTYFNILWRMLNLL